MKSAFLGMAGIVLFLYGMTSLSEAIKQIFTVRMRDYIRMMTQNRASGFFMGIIMTILFQSSSATTVLTVGLVSAGLISFYHSLAVILGADLGTTVTIQLIAWRLGDLSPLFMVIGAVGWYVAEGRKRLWFSALFNFGLMFFGLFLVSLATHPLKEHPIFFQYLKAPTHPIIAFSLGLVFTGIVQASAITVGILVFLVADGFLSVNQAIPIVFGANVGTTITAILAAFVATPAGRRTAAAHFFFKLVGAIMLLPFSSQLSSVLNSVEINAGQKIVLVHFIFNGIVAVCFLFFIPMVARLIEKILPGEENTLPLWPEYISSAFLEDPDRALDAARKEIVRQGEISRQMFELAARSTVKYKSSYHKDIFYLELIQNNLREEIINYLRCISTQELSSSLAGKLFAYTAMADDIERMSNHMVSIVELSRQKARRRIAFTSYAMAELEEIKHHLRANLSDAISLIEGTQEELKIVKSITFREERIDTMVKEARHNHLARFHQRLCQAEAGPIFLEMLIHLERISDHCQNIADFVGEMSQESTNA
ncbi:MAG: Na/Pi cotransporter family protein [Syntrophales bacterium]|nr:Na/Pi cotransporter family protein [Syntrophales bacterium]